MKKRGQALVEFVIILPILMMFFFGSVDIGRIIIRKNELENLMSDTIKMYTEHKSINEIRYYLKLNDDTFDIEILSYPEDEKLDVSQTNTAVPGEVNKALVNLFEKYDISPEKIVVDQFVYSKKYFEHINNANKKITNITFLTKAESKVFSVAAASIISRYFFLNEISKINNNIKDILPLGAGSDVDETAKKLVAKHGKEILTSIAKVNFKNTDRILNN